MSAALSGFDVTTATALAGSAAAGTPQASVNATQIACRVPVFEMHVPSVGPA